MKIRKLYIRQFGALSDHTVEFSDGINVLERDNEEGKTTIALFIRCMLYSISGRKSGKTLNLRERVIPFDKENASGYMDIESGGSLYRISRVIGKTPKSDTLQIMDLKTNTLIHTDREPGDYFTGFSENTFMDIFYMDDKEISGLTQDISDIKERLTNKAYTGDDSVSCDKAIRDLNDQMKILKNQRTGKGIIDNLERKREELLNLLPEVREKKRLKDLRVKELEEKENEIKKLKEESLRTQEKLKNIRNLKESSGYSEYLKLKTKAEILSSEFNKYDTGKDLKFFDDRLLKVSELKDIRNEIEGKKAELNSCETALGLSDTYDSHVFEDPVKSSIEKYFRSRNYLKIMEYVTDFLMLAALFMAVKGKDTALYFTVPVIFLGFFFLKDILGLIPYIVTLGITIYLNGAINTYSFLEYALTGVFILMLIYKLNEKNRIKRLLADTRYQDLTFSSDVYQKDLKNHNLKKNENVKIYDEAVLLRSEIAEKQNEYDLKKTELYSEIRSFITGISLNFKIEPETFENVLEENKIRQENAEKLRNELDKLGDSLKSGLAVSESAGFSDYRELMNSENQTEEKADALTEKIHEKEIEILNLKHSISDSDSDTDEPDVLENISETEGRIEKLNERFYALRLAKEELEKVVSSLSENYIPLLSKKTSEIFQEITSDKDRNIRLDSEFNLMFEDSSIYRRHDFLSKGTRSALWFGLRLAIYDILKNGDDLPLIFDESFVHLDDRRYGKVLKFLKDKEKFSQILILTCHDKTENLLKEIDNGLYSS